MDFLCLIYCFYLLSGIQQHLLFGAVGAAIGIIGQKLYDDHNNEKNAVYAHYITLHPEDFPMPGIDLALI